jgi:hypothetical protein
MIGVSRQLPNLFRLSASKLTLDVTTRGTAEHAERDFENRDIRAMVGSLHLNRLILVAGLFFPSTEIWR